MEGGSGISNAPGFSLFVSTKEVKLLKIIVGAEEFYDDEKGFYTSGGTELELEHSLLSLSKWESIFEKPFLDKKEKTEEELVGYIEAMIVTPNFPRGIVQKMSEENVETINVYIDRKMTATRVGDPPGPPNREIITSELIYYWMTELQIPFECERWNLNRLIMLIKVCNVKRSKPKKMSVSEIADRNRRLNAERRASLGSKG